MQFAPSHVGSFPIRTTRLLIAAGLLGMLLLAAPSAAKTGLTLGMIDDSPSKMSKRFGPLMDYLSAQGIATGKVVTAKSQEQGSGEPKPAMRVWSDVTGKFQHHNFTQFFFVPSHWLLGYQLPTAR